MANLAAFEKRLGHVFTNSELLERALSHASLDIKDDNERLEFLGDRVLGLVIAEHLLARYSEESEGEMARRFNQLVSRDTCAQISANWRLADVLRMHKGSQKKATVTLNVLADSCEAVLAAVYLDAGLEAARAVIEAHWQSYFVAQTDAPVHDKTALQEWLMQRGQDIPVYEIIDRTGPAHAPHFTVEARAADNVAQGSGSSRKLAEQKAASALLSVLQGDEGA